MPNHITNKIELTGATNDIKELIAAFSTFYPATPSLAHDGSFIYKTKGEDYKVGWWDGNKFTQRDKPDLDYIPDEFEQEIEEEWTRFPDFQKVLPMPEGLEVSAHSGIETWAEICLGMVDFNRSSSNNIESLIANMSASTALETVLGKRDRKSVKDFSDEEFNVFVQIMKNYRKHGYLSWYKWSIDNWGTKWNSYSCKKISDTIFQFDTAWSGVPELIKIISTKFPNVTISYKYSDEDTGSNCGIGEFKGGLNDLRKLENNSLEAYELAFELHPNSKENFKRVGDKYEYVEED